MIVRLLLVLAFLLPLPALAQGAGEPKLVPDVSQRNINIQSRFTGAELLMFGAIIYPRGVAPEGQIDVAVVLRGPTRPIIVRAVRPMLVRGAVRHPVATATLVAKHPREAARLASALR